MSEATRRRKEVAEKALAEGVSPLDVLLVTMRTLWDQAHDPDGKLVNMGKAIQAINVAKDAAPYVHPRLSSVAADVNNKHDFADSISAVLKDIADRGRPRPT